MAKAPQSDLSCRVRPAGLPTPKVVLLDFDDTLFDNGFVPASVEEACIVVAASAQLDAGRLLVANRSAWRLHWPEVERRCWIGEMEVLDASREVWRRALAECGCEDSAVVDFAYETHQDIGRDLARLFDDVPDFLHTLTLHGIDTALVTNSSVRAQTAKLAAVDLDGFFTAVVISGELGVAKPDPRIFAAALERLGASASEAWHIGDNPSTDIAGARAAGVTSVWLDRLGRSLDRVDPQPDLHVRSLVEVTELLSG